MNVTAKTTTKKWTRARVPRVRTGCITCKQRHVKCDERKPGCKKCEDAKWTCDGYEANLTRRRPGKRQALAPPDTRMVALRGSMPKHPSILPRLTLNGSEKSSEMELLYHVRTATVQDLISSVCPMEFWYIYALPLGHAAGPIKHALCALGSTHKYFKRPRSINSKYVPPAHRELVKSSIEQYNQAIHHIKSLIQTPSRQNTEAVLICCIIFMSIESLQGRYSECLKHFRSAAAILTSLLDLPPQSSPVTPTSPTNANQSRPNDLYKIISHMLLRVSQDLGVYIGDVVIPDLNLALPLDVDVSFSTTPFCSAADAGNSLFSIMRFFDAETFVYELENPVIALNSASDANSWHGRFPMPPHDCSVQMAKLKPYFDSWNTRFNIYCEQRDDKSISKQELRQTKEVAILQAMWTGLLRNGNILKDLQREDVEEILLRAESFVSESVDDVPVFAWDGTLISSLTILYTSCCDFDTQKRIIRLLRSTQRREGIWESHEVANIFEAITIARQTNQCSSSWEELPWYVPQLAKLAASYDIPNLHIAMGALSLNE